MLSGWECSAVMVIGMIFSNDQDLAGPHLPTLLSFLSLYLPYDVPVVPHEAAIHLIPSTLSLLSRKHIVHPALHVLLWIIFPFYHLLEKLHLSSAPGPRGKTSINKDLVFPSGVCPFWCHLLSLLGSYSSKSGLFLQCIFSKMPGKSSHMRNAQISRAILIQKSPECKGIFWSFK